MTNETKTQEPAAFKEVHLYHQTTGEYLGPYNAQLCPVENTDEYLQKNPPKYLTPIHHTEAIPHPTTDGQVNVFVDGQWIVKPDHRGKVIYHQKSDDHMTVENIGDIPADYDFTPPPLTPEKIKAQAQASVSVFDALIAALIYKKVISQKDIDAAMEDLVSAQVLKLSKQNKK